MDRASGILMHISSLPGDYGIGTMGREAERFADFLSRAKQRYWQILPIGPTGYGDSPYQSFSAFAGNPHLIDVSALLTGGLLLPRECEEPSWGEDPERVDFSCLYEWRIPLLKKAFYRSRGHNDRQIEQFEQENEKWLPDYALFMALKEHFHMEPWSTWPDALRRRELGALTQWRETLRVEMDFHIYVQYLFFSQWNSLKRYCNERGIRILGDMPIYVPLDSADVWAHPEYFQLDEARKPIWVAGVPPDYFSSTGQLWGSPVYDWGNLKSSGYQWWIDRMEAAASLFDALRIDHFRGFDTYWKVPCGERTAVNGEWAKGPGMDFLSVLKENFPDFEVVAEDLGTLTESVEELLEESGYPGMKVLQFAFDTGGGYSSHLPHAHRENCIAYTGTHDNTTAAGWFAQASAAETAFAKEYLGLNDEEGPVFGLIRGGMVSPARIFIAQMQDYLCLPAWARMNTPSTVGGNWAWRMKGDAATAELACRIAHLAEIYGR